VIFSSLLFISAYTNHESHNIVEDRLKGILIASGTTKYVPYIKAIGGEFYHIILLTDFRTELLINLCGYGNNGIPVDELHY